jgi:hypothetical protein
MATDLQVSHYAGLATEAIRMVIPAANDVENDELRGAIYAVARTAENYGTGSLQCILARREAEFVSVALAKKMVADALAAQFAAVAQELTK